MYKTQEYLVVGGGCQDLELGTKIIKAVNDFKYLKVIIT